MLSDTDLEAAIMQWELLHKMTSPQDSLSSGALTTAYFADAKRAIAQANPGATPREIDHIFISTHYGEELAQEVKAYLEARDQGTNP